VTLKTFWRRHWDETAAYGLSLGGALVSNNLEAFKGKEAIRLDFSLGRLGMAAFLALVMVFVMELVPMKLSEEVKEAAHRGKQKRLNLARRFLAASVFGFASPYLVDALVRALVGKVGG
jgi:hypothetical protein